MKKGIASLVLMGLLTACSSSTLSATISAQESEIQSPETGVLAFLPESGFQSKAITVEKVAIPFSNYNEWLSKVKLHSQSVQAVEKFKQAFPQEATDRLIKNTQSQWISYQSDGLKISGAMAWPKNWQGGNLPVVIYNRGGNFKHGFKLPQLIKYLLPIAEQGYLVLASNYRGSKYSEGTDEFGGADVNDVLRLIEIAKTIPNANGDKIALFGWSRGSMMTWQVMRQNTTDIDVAIVGAGVVDMFPEMIRRPEMEQLMQYMIPEYEQNKKSALTHRSAIYWMEELNPEVPVLLLHGDNDWRVDVSQSRRAAERLSALNHPHELVIYPGDDHSLSQNREDVQRRIYQFLDAHLR